MGIFGLRFGATGLEDPSNLQLHTARADGTQIYAVGGLGVVKCVACW